MSSLFPIPVVLIIFNRPDTTARVVEQIRAIQPSKLFVIADGPRPHVASDDERCAAARQIIESTPWPCDIHRIYSETNLGAQKRIASGLNSVFEQVDRAIILEDDCLPHPSFFPFCAELLERYADDARVMSISGNNFQDKQPSTSDSYYFSRIMHGWGWATWHRAWAHFDLEMQTWPRLRNTEWFRSLHVSRRAAFYWTTILDRVYAGKIDAWDFIWLFDIWTQHGLNIHPAHNLVSNIGFGEHATHTRNPASRWANLPTAEMKFPLRHPSLMLPDVRADKYTQRTMFDGGWLRTLARQVKAFLSHD